MSDKLDGIRTQEKRGAMPAYDPRDPTGSLRYYGLINDCHADSDGDCEWKECPQLRDGEPLKSGRHCPLDIDDNE